MVCDSIVFKEVQLTNGLLPIFSTDFGIEIV